ncbi:hypothetical protein CN639_32060 [Bacillus toyonensis]|uniref:hypothetical protein n=1 Tax=Bacillus toyonensis TaxID=155322 RepID=UPI000BF194BB|nr:hypothetical protein [Bacillus toyonensis]PEM77653.1 hypothetical protein CN639_32060 [Bacillus toyonensis]PHC03879.1 hypothetical protein COF04_10175 [Bacillus toyonensis]PHC92201.1 hypothetical protein COF44_31605 [Bacillus toyonensis]
MANIYGPDQDLSLRLGYTKTVSVPKGYKAHFSFEKEAAWEQAICIYYDNGEPEYEQVAEKGTYAPLRDMNDWETPVNHSERDKEYIVSGWYKHGGWNQSPCRERQRPGNSNEIGFNDGGNDSDYNDIVAIYRLEHE